MRRLAIALAAVALPLTAAAAQPPALDPAALELARFLMARDPSLYDDADLGRFQARVQQDLLAQNYCNAFLSECQSQAIVVARQFAPAYRISQRERSERITAYLLADALRPEELRHVLQYVRSDEGGHFLTAMASLRDSDASQHRRRELQRMLERAPGDPLAEARALFRQRTRNLAPPPPR